MTLNEKLEKANQYLRVCCVEDGLPPGKEEVNVFMLTYILNILKDPEPEKEEKPLEQVLFESLHQYQLTHGFINDETRKIWLRVAQAAREYIEKEKK